MEISIQNSLSAQLKGLVSRGVKAVEIAENGHIIFTLTDNSAVDLGPAGLVGATFTPSVDAQGNISWTNDKQLTNPATVNIKGSTGDTGNAGVYIGSTAPADPEIKVWIDSVEGPDAVLFYTGMDLTSDEKATARANIGAEPLIQNGGISAAKLAVNATNATAEITLAATDWSSKTQTVDVTGMTATKVCIVSPAPSSFLAYNEAEVRATAQDAGTLTFACETVPSSALTVNVVMLT